MIKSYWDLKDSLTEPMLDGSILMHAPSQVFQMPGGGERQLVQTARYLAAAGESVRLFVPWTDRLEQSRLLHLFGMSREGLELAKVAKARKVPVAVSTICWLDPRSIWGLGQTLKQRSLGLAKWSIRRWGLRLGCWRSELLRLADVILPNSRAEGRQLVKLFGADPDKIQVVSNGVEERFALGDPNAFRESVQFDDYILYIGRIEPRKNALNLIRATNQLKKPLVIIGSAVPGFEDYAEQCRQIGDKRLTRFWGPMAQDDELLPSAYAGARVFALPSWFETPGLAALEAALAGCPVVITPYGCTREYFGPWARYARPDHIGEIMEQIEDAWRLGPNVGLAEVVGSRYDWSVVARRTRDAYERIAPSLHQPPWEDV